MAKGCCTILFAFYALTIVADMAKAEDLQQQQEQQERLLPSTPLPDKPPKLSGQHFRITILELDPWVTIEEDDGNGKLSFSGYLVDMLEEIASPNRANFTYELLTPSGFGSYCNPRVELPILDLVESSSPLLNTTTPNNNINDDDQQFEVLQKELLKHYPGAYDKQYRMAYRCGESDVNDRPISPYSTDMYWGAYYITPERLQVNKFTVAFAPPDRATLGMMGTATHIKTMLDLPSTNYAVCAYENTAYMESLKLTFPMLDIAGIGYGDDHYQLFDDGTCDVIIDGYPFLQQEVYRLYKKGKCIANGKPIGVIGEPLEYGVGQLAFGIRMDLPDTVLQTLNFWLKALMACFPDDPNGYCPNGVGSLSQMYTSDGGKGDECGYVQFPTEPTKRLAPGIIVAIALTPLILVIGLGMIYHTRQLKQQEKRMKKRFIQQLARNIDIGPTASRISAAKLSETFQHIGGKDGLISREDLSQWMNDVNLDFLSEKDFDRLWHTMDIDDTGVVEPLEFYAFLTECEKQFEEVYEEYSGLPKSEKVKLAARRLSNIEAMGAEEVQKLERRYNRRGRVAIPNLTSQRSLTTSSELMNNKTTRDSSSGFSSFNENKE